MLRLVGLSGLFVLALACAPVAAQSGPPADQGTLQDDQGAQPADQGGTPPGHGAMSSGKPTAKELIASCRADAKAKGLTGKAKKEAVDQCVGAERPKLAERLECRQQGKGKGLSGDELKSFVKTCMAQGPGGPSPAADAGSADQAPPPAGAAPADQGPPPGAAAAAPGKPSGKELIASCRADSKAKGLKGDALRAAVDECVGAERPKLAARLQCHQQGKAKGLAGDELKSFVKSCVAEGQ